MPAAISSLCRDCYGCGGVQLAAVWVPPRLSWLLWLLWLWLLLQKIVARHKKSPWDIAF
jgi:hypothetical protein